MLILTVKFRYDHTYFDANLIQNIITLLRTQQFHNFITLENILKR